MSATVPEFRNGKVVQAKHTRNYFDDVVDDWFDEERKRRHLEYKKQSMLLDMILKSRKELLGLVPKAMKSAEVKAAEKKRGQESFL